MTINRSGFNLVHDPWIPIGDSLVSIRDALIRSHELPGWPGGDFGLAETILRLLVPIVYRITAMDSPNVSDGQFAKRQAELFDKGHLDETSLNNYLDKHTDRFWLYGEPSGCQPFAQDPLLESVVQHPAAKAVTAWASGNNPVLGPHTSTDVLPNHLAVHRLLVLRAYAWGGTHTKHPVWAKKGKYVGGPLRGTMSVHPVGTTLATTLIGHLVPLPGGSTEFGVPFWEQPSPQKTVAPHSKRAGLLEQIAGRQDKTMLMRVNDRGKITGFTIAEGPGVDNSLFCEDPYLLYQQDGQPLKPKSNKAFWRESETLLLEDDSGKRSARARILDWATGEYNEFYEAVKRFSWTVVIHLGDRSKDLTWNRYMSPHLLRLFNPPASLRALSFMRIANKAEERTAKQLAKLWNKTGQMPTKPSDRATIYAAARSEFWKLAEQDFWEVVAEWKSQNDQEIKTRLYKHALAGFDRAVDHLANNQRSLMTVIDCRRWIEWWGISNDNTDGTKQKGTA